MIGDSRTPGVSSRASLALVAFTTPFAAFTRYSLPPTVPAPAALPMYTCPLLETGGESFNPASSVAGNPPLTTSAGVPLNTPVNLCRRPLPSPTQSTSST